MVTDGITEAANPDAELYGNARLQAALSSAGSLSPVHGLLQHLRQDVASFVDGAEASDDLAVLVLRWNGPTAGADPVPGA
jgi:serine phosphatase RsbU (regulator of sigma subunit)